MIAFLPLAIGLAMVGLTLLIRWTYAKENEIQREYVETLEKMLPPNGITFHVNSGHAVVRLSPEDAARHAAAVKLTMILHKQLTPEAAEEMDAIFTLDENVRRN